MKIARHIIISGIVQGVWFRQSTADMANALSLAGWVRNLSGGEVEAFFEGEEEIVQKALLWCEKGPPKAVVEGVLASERELSGLAPPFEVRPTA